MFSVFELREKLHILFCHKFARQPISWIQRVWEFIVRKWCRCPRFHDVDSTARNPQCIRKVASTMRPCKQPKKVHFIDQVDTRPLQCHFPKGCGNAFGLELLRLREVRARKIHLAEKGLQLTFCWLKDRDYSRYTGAIPLQAACRRYLAKENKIRHHERILNIPRFGNLPCDALTSAARGYLGRLAYRREQLKAVADRTAFPAIGSKWNGCGCWDVTHATLDANTANVLKFACPKGTLLKGAMVCHDNTYLLAFDVNGECFVMTQTIDTYFFYEAKTCHIHEGVFGFKNGHASREVGVLRHQGREIRVLLFRESRFLRDLSDYVEDQHMHVAIARSIVNRIDSDQVTTGPERMVLSRGEVMTSTEKSRRRRERRAENAALRRESRPVPRIQIPARYQGLTTQEFHEMQAREREEFIEEYAARGKKSLPQSCVEYLSSRVGNEIWNNIHARAITDPETAGKMLAKLNKHLSGLGLRHPLQLSAGKVALLTKARERAKFLRAKQKEAAEARGSKWQMSQELDKRLEAARETARKGTWAASTDDDDDFLLEPIVFEDGSSYDPVSINDFGRLAYV